jgi:hypothetical protein
MILRGLKAPAPETSFYVNERTLVRNLSVGCTRLPSITKPCVVTHGSTSNYESLAEIYQIT